MKILVKLISEEDCIVPHGQFIIKYKGPNPFKAAQATAKFMRRVMEVAISQTWRRL